MQVFGEERADELLRGCNVRQHCVAADPQPLCTFIYDIGTLHESSSFVWLKKCAMQVLSAGLSSNLLRNSLKRLQKIRSTLFSAA